jgi:hypothetical protein
VNKKDVFWLEIGMDEVQIMEDCTTLAPISRDVGRMLTGNAGEQLSSKVLNLGTWERHKAVAFEEIKDTLSEQVCDNADVVPEVEGVSQMDALVPVVLVIEGKRGQDSQLDSRGIAILLH